MPWPIWYRIEERVEFFKFNIKYLNFPTSKLAKWWRGMRATPGVGGRCVVYFTPFVKSSVVNNANVNVHLNNDGQTIFV